ncbi:phage tail length tape measure family protein, partial [Azospirillum oryzae]|uniref:phage tail length tape measure family protein n=1 Tax=Azospirillum oryzae TaxID=286727 RepID=UPI001ABF4A17
WQNPRRWRPAGIGALNASTSKLSTGYTALTEDQRKLYQQREQDAQQVDKLKRTYKTLEGALETLDVQVKNGWRSMEEAARLQPQLAAAYTRTGQAARQAGADLQAGTAAAKAAAAAQDAAHASTSKFGGSMSNLGYQVQDAAVQLQMGTNAFVVLAQQGSQAASAFGPLGAAIARLLPSRHAGGGHVRAWAEDGGHNHLLQRLRQSARLRPQGQ